MTMAAINMHGEPGPATSSHPALPGVGSAEEAHHRIANSLQLVSALIGMEQHLVADPAARAALDMTRRRIGAIARIHGQLYRARRASSIDLAAYLRDLAQDLASSFAAAGRDVLVDAAPVIVDANDAMAIGIIVSEVVTNACKYAYGPGQPGDVRISLRPLSTGGYVVAVEDRGRGIGHAASQGAGFGGMLIDMMASRLGGAHDYQDARPGTRFALRVAA